MQDSKRRLSVISLPRIREVQQDEVLGHASNQESEYARWLVVSKRVISRLVEERKTQDL